VSHPAATRVSVVVIGRNEGERLVRCLESARPLGAELIYVDSSSTDGSPERAAALGARVLRVRPERPSAAVGRNAGWRAARGEFVLFLDGDTVLHPAFVQRALREFRDPDVAVVWGHRRERDPAQSAYVRVLDLDWIYAPGDTAFCGGDALVRRSVLERTGGFDASLIAGEEPELCRRIRACGHRIVHIDAPMTTHDLAIRSLRAYWQRAFRAGHAYAEVAERYAASPDPLWRRESRRNLVHGAALLAVPPVLVAAWLVQPAAAALLVALGLLLLARSVRRCAWKSGSLATRVLYALHSHAQQVPILLGQLAYRRNRRRGLRQRLIDYKESA
jgi:glycosyltransferase involved in cell wall biosynthesis